jgi:YfiH family protein
VAPHFFTAATLALRDDPAEWALVAQLAGVPPDRLRLLNQVHGDRVVTAPPPSAAERPEADAIISDDPSLALVVRVADCAPILIADRRLGVVAAVHAGWRSSMRRFAPGAVAALHDTDGSLPRDLQVAIGPALGACCGEMGEEVVEAFLEHGHDRAVVDRWFIRSAGRKPHFDLWRANLDQLTSAGVPADAVHLSGLCTRTHARVFHSYRAAGNAAGRMAAVITANPSPPPLV